MPPFHCRLADSYAVDLLLLALFGATTPWLAIGFWNATIGFFIMRFTDDPSRYVVPQAARRVSPSAIVASTAILMCVRNELPDRVVRNLDAMMADIDGAGYADRFHVYVLSDTSLPDLLSAEAEAFGELARRWTGRLPLTYRRRTANTGYKAGNIRDFLDRWGDAHDLMVTLDADSYMTASAILRMVGIVQANPKLGILQGLVVGMPSTSAFARIFQFGMRLGMRSWTIGSAWWQADCGPYWGHNAVIRVAPFKRHCAIPVLPGKGLLRGHVLSHDQIEAALMRRAGYDVRVLPEEDLGWEENPPTLIEFIRRDLRWCQGTLQYVFFAGIPGLEVVSRFQLLFAMLMFVGSPAWIGLLLVSTLVLAATPSPVAFVDGDYGVALLATILVMWFAPKVATIVDVLCRPILRRRFGGTFKIPCQHRRRDDLFPDALAHHVDGAHALPGRASLRSCHRLDRTSPQRPFGLVADGLATPLASDHVRHRLYDTAGPAAADGAALRLRPVGRRSGAVGPTLRHHLAPILRFGLCAHRHRSLCLRKRIPRQPSSISSFRL